MGARFARETGWEGGSGDGGSEKSGSSGGSSQGSAGGERSKQELYEQAREQGVSGRSRMSKEELERAVDEQ